MLENTFLNREKIVDRELIALLNLHIDTTTQNAIPMWVAVSANNLIDELLCQLIKKSHRRIGRRCAIAI